MARTRILAVLAAAALASTVAGCAAVPSGGAPQRVTGGSGAPQAYALPMPPPPPQAGWTEDQVVLGFLHASASFADNWAAARQYLAPGLRKSWTPGAVTVVGSLGNPQVSPGRQRPPLPGGLTQIANVSFTGQRLATLTASGQYLYEPGNPVYTFRLVRTNGPWLIDRVPKGVLLLTQADFQDVYQPSNLYFFAPYDPRQSVPQGNLLVPDPVYAPIQGITRTTSASKATLATSLVKGLLQGPGSWLANPATWSAFPVGTTLIGNQVRISGQTAIVNLGGTAVKADLTTAGFMDAQLQATLTDSAYSAPVAHVVRLEIGGKVPYVVPRDSLIGSVVTSPEPPVFFLSGPSSVSQLTLGSKSARPVPAAGPAQIGHAVATTVAASGNSPRMLAIAAKAGRGCAVYVGISRGSGRYHRYMLSSTGGACTSLSLDRNGNIWATAGQHVWLIGPNRGPVTVGLPAGLSAAPVARQKGLRLLALRMAPDGIRAVFLVHTAAGNRILLAAIRNIHGVVSFGPAVSVGTGLLDAGAVGWYGAYNLVVLAGSADGSAVFEVPLTGGAGQQRQLGTTPDRTQSITTNGTEVVVSSPGGLFA